MKEYIKDWLDNNDLDEALIKKYSKMSKKERKIFKNGYMQCAHDSAYSPEDEDFCSTMLEALDYIVNKEN